MIYGTGYDETKQERSLVSLDPSSGKSTLIGWIQSNIGNLPLYLNHLLDITDQVEQIFTLVLGTCPP